MNGLFVIRKELNLSAATLAKKLDIAKPTISQWEHGVRKIPPERIKQLSEILDIPQNYFSEITDEQVEEVKTIISVNRQEDERNFEFEKFNQATKKLKSALQQINQNAQNQRSNFEFFMDYVSSIERSTKLCLLFSDVLKLYGTDSIVRDCLTALIQAKESESDSDSELTKIIRQEILKKEAIRDEMKKLSEELDELF